MSAESLALAGSRPNFVYVASSWRNPIHAAVCAALRSCDIPHYDFKNPPGGTGFSWKQVKPQEVVWDHEFVGYRTNTNICSICGAVRPMPCYQSTVIPGKGSDWEPVDTYLQMVNHPVAIDGYHADFSAMEQADTFVLVLPCGKSAHLELGWAVGAGKRTAILLEDPVEPELMYRMVDYLAPSLFDLLGWLGVGD